MLDIITTIFLIQISYLVQLALYFQISLLTTNDNKFLHQTRNNSMLVTIYFHVIAFFKSESSAFQEMRNIILSIYMFYWFLAPSILFALHLRSYNIVY